MEPKITTACEHDIGGDEQRVEWMSTTYRNTTFKHILLPLWISSYRYNEKVYRTIVNAQTGHVAGERPYSVPKIVLFVLVCAAIIGAIVYLTQRDKPADSGDTGALERPALIAPAA
jgi:hypothetical protein